MKKIAKFLYASNAETEVEKLLLSFLKDTKFANKTHAVGGYTRDQYMGKEAHDLDIVVEMDGGAKQITHFIKQMFPVAVTTPYNLGEYPIWEITFKDSVVLNNKTYHTKGAIIQFADTMRETFPDPESRQRNTEYASLKFDVARRDFSINSLLKDLTTGEFIDLTGVSKSDIKNGILRTNPDVDPDEIFSADPLRMVRLLRFYAKFNFKIPKFVLESVKRNAHRIKIVSAERIIEELKKIMEMGKLHQAIELMKDVGLLQYILPEVDDLQHQQQSPKFHAEGHVFQHTMNVLKNAPPTIHGQLAALLHDIGKPNSAQILEDNITFHGHEEVGSEIAKAILQRLKLDTQTIDKVVKMVRHHMRPHFLIHQDSGNKALRRFIRDIGEELVDDILDLAEADALGSSPVVNEIPELREKIKNIRMAPVKPTNKPVLDGNEIIEILNIKPGPLIREINQYLLDLQDEYAEKNKELTKEEAKSLILKKFK